MIITENRNLRIDASLQLSDDHLPKFDWHLFLITHCVSHRRCVCVGGCDHYFVSQIPLLLYVPLKRLLEGLWSKSNVLMVSACSHVSSELCLITIFTKSDRVWFVNTKHPIVFPFSQSCLSIGHSPPPSTRFFFYSFLIINIKLEAEIATKLLNVTSANPFSQTGCFF